MDPWNLKEHLTCFFLIGRILLILEKEECWIEVNLNTSTEQVYEEVWLRFHHNSSQVHFCPVDSAGITGQPLHSSKEIKPLLENLHLFQQPIILRLLEKELWIMRSYQMLKFRSIISIWTILSSWTLRLISHLALLFIAF